MGLLRGRVGGLAGGSLAAGRWLAAGWPGLQRLVYGPGPVPAARAPGLRPLVPAGPRTAPVGGGRLGSALDCGLRVAV